MRACSTDSSRNSDDDEREGLISSSSADRDDAEVSEEDDRTDAAQTQDRAFGIDHKSDWRAKIKLLVYSFAGSAVYVRNEVSATSVSCSPSMPDHRVLFRPASS